MNRSMFFVVFSLFLTTAAMDGNANTIRWGHQPIADTDDVVLLKNSNLFNFNDLCKLRE